MEFLWYLGRISLSGGFVNTFGSAPGSPSLWEWSFGVSPSKERSRSLPDPFPGKSSCKHGIRFCWALLSLNLDDPSAFPVPFFLWIVLLAFLGLSKVLVVKFICSKSQCDLCFLHHRQGFCDCSFISLSYFHSFDFILHFKTRGLIRNHFHFVIESPFLNLNLFFFIFLIPPTEYQHFLVTWNSFSRNISLRCCALGAAKLRICFPLAVAPADCPIPCVMGISCHPAQEIKQGGNVIRLYQFIGFSNSIPCEAAWEHQGNALVLLTAGQDWAGKELRPGICGNSKQIPLFPEPGKLNQQCWLQKSWTKWVQPTSPCLIPVWTCRLWQ